MPGRWRGGGRSRSTGSTRGSASSASTRSARSPQAPGTRAYWSAQTALTALDALLAGERAAFALCRPPGHHCGADYLGGYCYLNSAAIAAEAATAAGEARRDPRRRLSSRQRHPGHLLRARRHPVRLDPRRSADRLSLLLGPCRRDRRRRGRRRHSQPAAAARHRLGRLSARARHGAGEDRRLRAGPARHLLRRRHLRAATRSPNSGWRRRTIAAIARRIAALGLPALIVMEGGYAVDALGANVAAFLEGFE